MSNEDSKSAKICLIFHDFLCDFYYRVLTQQHISQIPVRQTSNCCSISNCWTAHKLTLPCQLPPSCTCGSLRNSTCPSISWHSPCHQVSVNIITSNFDQFDLPLLIGFRKFLLMNCEEKSE